MNEIMNSAVKQALSLQLVQLSEMKLSLRPKNSIIPTDVQITQVVVSEVIIVVMYRFLLMILEVKVKQVKALALWSLKNMFMH